MNNTLYDNIFNNHIINKYDDLYIIFIDQILLHEVTSPQAFNFIKNKIIWDKKKVISTSDHNVSTLKKNRILNVENNKQLLSLKKNCKKYFFKHFSLNNPKQGIIHIISSENFFLYPGMIIICGDSHTTTNGALSLIANGIGTTDLSFALSTQCIIQKKFKNMGIFVFNFLNKNITSKDLILHIIKKISSKGGVGYCIEFSGTCIQNLSISEKKTICNMSIEAGSKISIINPDDKIFEFYSKKIKNFYKFYNYIEEIKSKKNSFYEKKFFFNAFKIKPCVTWGTNLDTIINLNDKIITKDIIMLEYMGLKNNQSLIGIKIDKVFIGSCTNSRFEDLMLSCNLLLKINKKVNNFIKAYIVPGSEKIRLKAEFYGLDKIFKKYNFIWRNSGCSFCLAMNDDKILPYERCVSTSNRNFVGRQGYKSRTHLCSPILATILSIYGEFIDINTYNFLTNDNN